MENDFLSLLNDEMLGKNFDMSLNLMDYVKIFNVLSPSFCNDIIKNLKIQIWSDHTFYNNKIQKDVVYDFDLSVTWDSKYSSDLTEIVWHSIDRYVKELNFYFFDGWVGFNPIRFNKYEKNKAMRLHCDHIHSIFTGDKKGIPILSVVGYLNDDYEGGEFILCNQHIALKQGDILIFPSIFLYPHKVLPVTKGTRYSFVTWVW